MSTCGRRAGSSGGLTKKKWLETTRSMSDKIELERVYAALFGCWRVQRYVGEPLHDALWGKDRMFWR